MTDQIEFANVIILNKSDLVTKDEISILNTIIKKLSPSAKIIESTFSKIDINEIINTGQFNFEEAEQSAGWLEELKMSISLKLKNMVSLLLFFETKDLLIQKNFGITFKGISPFSY